MEHYSVPAGSVSRQVPGAGEMLTATPAARRGNREPGHQAGRVAQLVRARTRLVACAPKAENVTENLKS